jgi:Zn ribbon nucleic-acid-binding protein
VASTIDKRRQELMCRACGESRPRSEFSVKGNGGRPSRRCNTCRARKEISTAKCPTCGETKVLAEFVRGTKPRAECNACAAKRPQPAKATHKTCPQCSRKKPMESFRTGGCYQRVCGTCRTAEAKRKAKAAAEKKAAKASDGPYGYRPVRPGYQGWANLEFGFGVAAMSAQVHPWGHADEVAA